MKNSRLLIILGNLTAFGPFITDFYLPCLPELTSCFSASVSLIQVSLTAGMLGLAIGQLFVGPVADKYGRKKPLLYCLGLFVLSTVGCMSSTGISPFIFFRLLQGMTGSCGLVISKVIIADTFTASDTAKYFAVLAAVQGAAPIVAPVMGGVAFHLTSWQGVFAVLVLWGLALLVVCRKLKETLPKENRVTVPIYKSFKCYVPVIRNNKYLVMILLQGFSNAALMTYIASSPFIFQIHFGMSPLHYSFCFAFNAFGLVAGSSIVVRIKNMRLATDTSVAGLFITCSLISVALFCKFPFFLFEAVLFLMLFCVGMLTPASMTLALKTVHDNKGAAAALLGSVPFLFGGIVAPLTGMGNMIHSMLSLIMSSSFICVSLCWISRKWEY